MEKSSKSRKYVTIVSWNVNSVRARIDLLLSWISENKPDVLLLQEVKAICSRVIIINQGQKVFDESMDNIKDDLEKIFFELTMSTN